MYRQQVAVTTATQKSNRKPREFKRLASKAQQSAIPATDSKR
jgi:hypothetical protein